MDDMDETDKSTALAWAFSEQGDAWNASKVLRSQYVIAFEEKKWPVRFLVDSHVRYLEDRAPSRFQTIYIGQNGTFKPHKGSVSFGRHKQCNVVANMNSRCQCILLYVDSELFLVQVGGLGSVYLKDITGGKQQLTNIQSIPMPPHSTIHLVMEGFCDGVSTAPDIVFQVRNYQEPGIIEARSHHSFSVAQGPLEEQHSSFSEARGPLEEQHSSFSEARGPLEEQHSSFSEAQGPLEQRSSLCEAQGPLEQRSSSCEAQGPLEQRSSSCEAQGPLEQTSSLELSSCGKIQGPLEYPNLLDVYGHVEHANGAQEPVEYSILHLVLQEPTSEVPMTAMTQPAYEVPMTAMTQPAYEVPMTAMTQPAYEVPLSKPPACEVPTEVHTADPLTCQVHTADPLTCEVSVAVPVQGQYRPRRKRPVSQDVREVRHKSSVVY